MNPRTLGEAQYIARRERYCRKPLIAGHYITLDTGVAACRPCAIKILCAETD